MSPDVSPGIIIPICTWSAIVLFIIPFVLSCCITYCKQHPQSKMAKCIHLPMFLTKQCLNSTFKHNKYKVNNDVHVNKDAEDIENGTATTTTNIDIPPIPTPPTDLGDNTTTTPTTPTDLDKTTTEQEEDNSIPKSLDSSTQEEPPEYTDMQSDAGIEVENSTNNNSENDFIETKL